MKLMRFLLLCFLVLSVTACESLFGLEEPLADELMYTDISGSFQGQFAFDTEAVNSYELTIIARKLCRVDSRIFGYDALLSNMDTGSQQVMTCTNVYETGRYECSDNDSYDPDIGRPEKIFAGRMDAGYKQFSGEWTVEAIGFEATSGSFAMTRTRVATGTCL